MAHTLQQGVAAVFLVAVAGVFFYSAPPFGAIWRSIIIGCAVLGIVIAVVGHFTNRSIPGGPKE